MIAGWLVGCALRAVPHYQSGGVALDPVRPALLEQLPERVERRIGTRRLRSWTSDRGVSELDALPNEVLYALYACSRGWSRGAELDLRVDVGEGPRPVTLRWTSDGRVELGWSDLEPRRFTTSSEAVVRETGIGGFAGDLPWADDEIGDVALALDRLSEGELRTLEGVTFARSERSRRAPRRERAYFDPSTEPPTLWFFDLAFVNEQTSFVGRVEDPIAAGAKTALHEVGHVVADVPLRRASELYFHAAARDLRRDALSRYRALGRGGVVTAWDTFREGRPGPSSYGFRDPDESFAEGFALYHLDPEALERAIPGAVAWFASGAHLEAAGLSTLPNEE